MNTELLITTETADQRDSILLALTEAEENGELDFAFNCQTDPVAPVTPVTPPVKSFLAVSPNYWGRSTTQAKAKAQLRRAGGTTKGEYFVYVTDGEKPYVDEMGYQHGGEGSTYLLMIEDTRKK